MPGRRSCSGDPARGEHASYGVLQGERLVAALGLVIDSPHSAEFAYWIRPEQRRRGIGLRSVAALTAWAHRGGGMARLWLEIDPGNTGPWSWPAAPATSWSSSCRGWIAKDPDRDQWHGCLIFAHTLEVPREP